MENLIQEHQQAKQKMDAAGSKLAELKSRREELVNKTSKARHMLSLANGEVSKALTAKDLEVARENVSIAQQYSDDVDTLIKNIDREISLIEHHLPAMRNNLGLAERQVWMGKCDQLTQEIKAHSDVIELIKKAFVAYWNGGHEGKLEFFIKNEIIGGQFADVGSKGFSDIFNILDGELKNEIWPEKALIEHQ